MRDLKDREGGPIWLVGGGRLNTSLLDEQLVNEIRLFVQPVLLGDGVGLFATPRAGTKLGARALC